MDGMESGQGDEGFGAGWGPDGEGRRAGEEEREAATAGAEAWGCAEEEEEVAEAP